MFASCLHAGQARYNVEQLKTWLPCSETATHYHVVLQLGFKPPDQSSRTWMLSDLRMIVTVWYTCNGKLASIKLLIRVLFWYTAWDEIYRKPPKLKTIDYIVKLSICYHVLCSFCRCIFQDLERKDLKKIDTSLPEFLRRNLMWSVYRSGLESKRGGFSLRLISSPIKISLHDLVRGSRRPSP